MRGLICELQCWGFNCGYGGCCGGGYLQQAEHGVAHVEAVPPVVVGDGTVTLPHCVHPSGQRLRGGRGTVMRMDSFSILE